MFVQVIRGKVSDPESLRERMNVWIADLKPGAEGWLGSTGGVTDEGIAFLSARFESREAAERNSNRPEQGAWWSETAKVFDEDPSFFDYDHVVEFRGGGNDEARFVQVMHGRVNDVEKSRKMDAEFSEFMGDARPDLLGGVSCSRDDGTFTSINYFTSEDEARAAESQEMPEEMQEGYKEWQSLIEEMEWIDLKQPWMHSA